MRRNAHRSGLRAGVVAALFALPMVVGVLPTGQAAGVPVPPGGSILSGLSAPSVTAGGSTAITFRVANPASYTMSQIVLTLEVYAENGYPGGSPGGLPVAGAPFLGSGAGAGYAINVSVGLLLPSSAITGSVPVTTSTSTPSGTYAVRTALAFTANGSRYVLESRGWFSASAWANATQTSNGTGTVNLTRLGVDGVVPETSVLVAPSSWPIVLGVVLGVGLLLVAVGAGIYFRRGPRSRSGAGNPGPGASQAPSAFGKSRKSRGDSRRS